jgi:hypothetical protein
MEVPEKKPFKKVHLNLFYALYSHILIFMYILSISMHIFHTLMEEKTKEEFFNMSK